MSCVTELTDNCWRHVKLEDTERTVGRNLAANMNSINGSQKMIDERIEQLKEAAPFESKWGQARKGTTMRKMKIYISGPMTGYKDLNRLAFREVQETLEAMGHEVFNPTNTYHGTRRLSMEADLVWICRHAEGMVMLFNGVRSSGSAAELAAAKALELPVWYQIGTDLEKFMSYDRFSETGGALYLGKAS